MLPLAKIGRQLNGQQLCRSPVGITLPSALVGWCPLSSTVAELGAHHIQHLLVLIRHLDIPSVTGGHETALQAFSADFHLAWCAPGSDFRSALPLLHIPQSHSSPANAVQPQIIAWIANVAQTRQSKLVPWNPEIHLFQKTVWILHFKSGELNSGLQFFAFQICISIERDQELHYLVWVQCSSFSTGLHDHTYHMIYLHFLHFSKCLNGSVFWLKLILISFLKKSGNMSM